MIAFIFIYNIVNSVKVENDFANEMAVFWLNLFIYFKKK